MKNLIKLDFVIIIPARYASSRLPGKPLIKICGVPMIVRTYNQCASVCPKEKIYVACDDIRIKKICESNDINVIMTSKKCLTGTDRVAECAKKIQSNIYINVQGDEPIFDKNDVKVFIKNALKFPDEILNGYTEIKSEKDFRNHNIPKVVINEQKKLLYMSRGSIPNNKSNIFQKSWRQVCIYSFPKSSLVKFKKNQKKTRLEKIEDIEILRFLEMGYSIRMIHLSSNSISVDVPKDINKVENIIKSKRDSF